MARGTGRALGVTALVATMLLPACSKDETPPPDDAARKLAEGVAKGDLSGAPLTGDAAGGAQDYLKKAYAGMDGLRPRVTVSKVEQDGDKATASLHLDWDLDATDDNWVYDTTAHLRYADGAWKTEWDPALVAPDLQSAEVLRIRSTPAERAGITGLGGQEIVTRRPVWRVGIDKGKVADAAVQEKSARTLATALELDPDHFATVVKQAGAQAFVPFLTVRAQGGLTQKQADTVDTTVGAVKIPDQLPLAPSRGFAGAYLGRVSPASAEDIQKAQGRLRSSDTVGKGGLQGRFDQQLRGTSGIKIVAVNPATTDLGRLLHERASAPGKPLATTLDVKAQNAADAALKDVKNPSAAVVIKASTGEVVAVSNGSQGYDIATLGQMAPGSTFKVASALALVRSGLTAESKVDCPEKTTVQGRSFQNYADYPQDKNGSITLKDAIANSCNTAFILASTKVDQAAVVDAAQGLGLGKPEGAKSPWFLGAVPADAAGTEHAAGMIGQGRNLASPLGMATVMASVLKGETVTPVLLPEAEPAQPLNPAHPVTKDEAAQLRTMMRAVVTDGGGEALKDLPGEVVAKTGTAEYGAGNPPKRHTWMIAGQGDYAAAVFVEDGEFGSTTCGPVMHTLLKGLPSA